MFDGILNPRTSDALPMTTDRDVLMKIVKPLSLLGLDLGTHTGFARLDVSHKGTSYLTGAWDFTPTRFDSPGLRYSRFAMQLREQFVLGVDKVFYEKVMRHLGTAAAHAYGAYLAVLHMECEAAGIQFEGLSVQEIKTFATGKGNANKDKMVAAIKAWGFNPKTEDEADAIAIVKCGWEMKS
jgi:Holliday junction resolvasome RuvABC endonuclease subunit